MLKANDLSIKTIKVRKYQQHPPGKRIAEPFQVFMANPTLPIKTRLEQICAAQAKAAIIIGDEVYLRKENSSNLKDLELFPSNKIIRSIQKFHAESHNAGKVDGDIPDNDHIGLSERTRTWIIGGCLLCKDGISIGPTAATMKLAEDKPSIDATGIQSTLPLEQDFDKQAVDDDDESSVFYSAIIEHADDCLAIIKKRIELAHLRIDERMWEYKAKEQAVVLRTIELELEKCRFKHIISMASQAKGHPAAQ